MTPRVSVVIPTRNRRKLLERALASVDLQSFRDFEVLVVDDGSEDDTAVWVREMWPSVSLVEMGRPCGAAAARNRGVERARGDLIAFLDDDDTWRPSYLEMQVANFYGHPETDLCTTGHIEIDPSGRISWPDLRPLCRYVEPLAHLLAECPIHTLSLVCCRRSVFRRLGGFDESLSIVHDLDLYLRLVASGRKTTHYPPALVERAIPGGLVTRHRLWFREERVVHRRFFATGQLKCASRRKVAALRSLFFARLGLVKGDFGFAFHRLVEAISLAPICTIRTATVRLSRNLRGRTSGTSSIRTQEAQ
jgi:glycosyltransferase involved in cell wall biosynthesis